MVDTFFTEKILYYIIYKTLYDIMYYIFSLKFTIFYFIIIILLKHVCFLKRQKEREFRLGEEVN